MSGSTTRGKLAAGGVAVRYTPCVKTEHGIDGSDLDCEQIAIVGESSIRGQGVGFSSRADEACDGRVTRLSKTPNSLRRGAWESYDSDETGGRGSIEHHHDIVVERSDDTGEEPRGSSLSRRLGKRQEADTIVTCNGPRYLPLGPLFSNYSTPANRVKLIGER